MKITIKHIVFVVLLVLMAFPAFQHATKLFHVKDLHGDFVLAKQPAFSWEKWMNSSFQSHFDRYIEDHIGFRPFFVRLNNQIDFGLFARANAEGVVVGKDKVLYEYDYIRAFTGGDFIGKSTIEKKLRRVKFLQKHLKENFDIDFVLIFEPSKARVLPEYIPERYLEEGISLSNYEYFKEKSDDLNIRYIDLNQYFMQVKDTSAYPLYPPYGIHWSEYTMSFVADTLATYIEDLRNIDMPDFRMSKLIISDSVADSDYDVGKTLNLLWELTHPTMPYPVFEFESGKNADKPMVLAVADSYYWNFFNTRLPENLFANQAFWYFNAKVYPDFYYGEKWTHELDLKQEIEKQDVILLSVTERFLYKFDWGFVDQIYDIYTPEYTGDIIYKYENLIRKDAGWFDNIVRNAEKRDVPLKDALRREAAFQAFQEEPDIYFTWYGLEYHMSVIRNNEKWNQSIHEKARQNKISYDEQLAKDAIFIFRKDHPEIYKKYSLINEYEKAIKSDPEWLNQVEEKANDYCMTVDEMIRVDAEYLAEQELQEVDPWEQKVKDYEQLIRNDPRWLENVRKKAEEQGKPLEQMIREDAEYMVEQEQKKK